MKTKLSFLFVFCVLTFGCQKDNFDSKPKLKINDIKVSRVTCESNIGGTIEIDMKVEDREGDVKDSIFIQKIDATKRPCPDNSILKNLDYKIPDYPTGNTQNISFRVKFATVSCQGYALIGGPLCRPDKDTSYFKIWVKDLGGNISDTLVTDPIPIP